ncbi:MAG: hypothetical protein IPM52_01195 [Bacteroidetes bacterium]|nr:hypothetical protein [Bacteroidota bacterium]
MKRTLKMMSLALMAMILSFAGKLSFAQTILKETIFDPSGKANIVNLQDVVVDRENKEIRLIFMTKQTSRKLKGELLTFDMDFNLKNSEQFEEELERMRTRFGFSLNFCPESREPLLTLEANNFTGQAVFKRGYIDRYFNWETGWCDDRFKIEERVRPRGDDGEKIKLVAWWTINDVKKYQALRSNVKYSYQGGGVTKVTYSQSRQGRVRDLASAKDGDAVLIGLVAEKGLVKENLGKNYTVQKFSADKLEKLAESAINFPVIASPQANYLLESGNMALIFYREDGKYEYIEVNYDAQVERRFEVNSPIPQRWLVLGAKEEGDAVYVHGLVSTKKYDKQLYGEVSMIHMQSATQETLLNGKTSGYMLMKVTDKGVEWIKHSSLAEFKAKSASPDGEKSKPYAGGRVAIKELYVNPQGELLVAGQLRTGKGEFRDVTFFHFSPQGDLLRSYTSALRDKNSYNKLTPTEHAFISTENATYWTVFEVAGAKKSGTTARTLYYPRIATVKPNGAGVNKFKDIGERKFYLDDKYPVNWIEGNTFFFLGATRNGKNLWFNKIHFD